MNTLGIIPARAGSKRLPRKNIKLVNGTRPLLCWTIAAALASKRVNKVIISTDCPEIMKIAESEGCEVPFQRPEYLARDDTSSADVVKHALKEMPGFDNFVLLQPTSPARHSEDIDCAINLAAKSEHNSCVSVTQSPHNTSWPCTLDQELKLKKVPSDRASQKLRGCSKIVYINGAIYCSSVGYFLETMEFIGLNTLGYEMPVSRSIDIDTIDDFRKFENYVRNK